LSIAEFELKLVHNVQGLRLDTAVAHANTLIRKVASKTKGIAMLHWEANCFAVVRRVTVALSSLLSISFFLASVSEPAQSQSYKVIHNFTAKSKDGASPYAGPIFDAEGNLLGTTYLGGGFGGGAVYKLAPNGSSWTYSTLYSLKNVPDGSGPAFGSLALGADHALFGTTEGGGFFGTAFMVCACATREAVVHSFGMGTDGAEPIGGLAFDSVGNFYGTTLLGGDSGNGTVFEGKRSQQGWTESVIYSFMEGSDAVNPVSGVSVDAQGNLYGTAPAGGVNEVGAVYKLSRSGSKWTETVLYNFQGQDDGQNPVGGVILDKDGNLYGTTFDGGTNGGGTVYQLSPSNGDWNFTVLYGFTGGYGGPYNKLTFDAEGNLYGVTNSDGANGLGAVFKLAPGSDGWTLTDLHDFAGGNDGSLPYGSVAVDASGNIFGTAAVGGTDNQGLVFEITP
jgi:uncharacterized repeat protein (TIGR03803 family)